jgi:hypothetical protein
VLATRAVPAAAVAGYELGYAPPGWTALTDHLRARGYTDTQLLDAGVGLRTRRGTVVDRFRDRLMFPVRDPGGQGIVGFLGRALTEGDDIPKYLNTRWADRLHWAEGGVGAARDAAAVIATLPPEHVGRQVLRVAERVGLDHAEVTQAVTDAVTRDGDAVGRLARRALRGDLDRGWESPLRVRRRSSPGPAIPNGRRSYPPTSA